MRMIGEDGSPDFAKVNQFDEAKRKEIRLDVGKYDVVVDVGPSYATKRQESAVQLSELMRSLGPQGTALIADLAVKSMDIADAQVISERLKKALLPPQLQENPEQQVPEQVQAMMAQMQAQLQELQIQNQSMSQIIANKQQELEAKFQIEKMKIESQQFIELAKLDSKEAIEGLNRDLELFKQEYDRTMSQLDFSTEPEPELGPESE